MSACPPAAAEWSGVHCPVCSAFGSAPAPISSAATSLLPLEAAAWSGVLRSGSIEMAPLSAPMLRR